MSTHFTIRETRAREVNGWRAPEWLTGWASDSWFRLRSWSQGCGIKPHDRLWTEPEISLRFSLPLPLSPVGTHTLSHYKRERKKWMDETTVMELANTCWDANTVSVGSKPRLLDFSPLLRVPALLGSSAFNPSCWILSNFLMYKSEIPFLGVSHLCCQRMWDCSMGRAQISTKRS